VATVPPAAEVGSVDVSVVDPATAQGARSRKGA